MPPGDAPLVPSPPPPRPARRDAAIDAAMRRFDGVEEPPSPAPDRPRPPWFRRPQYALAMTACLVAVIGLPAALIGLREQGSPPTSVSTAPSASPRSAQPGAPAAVVPKSPTASDSAVPAMEPPAVPPTLRR